jgi:D-amino-acid dehydrogenase
MKVAVIGAGMVGVAAAQAFAADGCHVTVFERRNSVAEETSFAPAGIAASGLAAPWRAPSGRLRTPWARDDEDPGVHETGAAFATRTLLGGAGRGAAQAVRNAERALVLRGLIEHGVERIDGLAQKLGLDFERDRGLLVTLADAPTAAQAEIAVDWLTQAGETVEWADAERQRRLEPGRNLPEDAQRAVYLPDALVGNTREWTQLLRAQAQSHGVRFLFQHEVVSLVAGQRPSLRCATPTRDGHGVEMHDAQFDAIVVCAALDSARLVAPLGVKLPWRAVRGCSITAPLHLREAAPDIGPRAAVLDVRSGIAITRLGTRVRVAGGHEITPRSTAAAAASEAPPQKALQPLYDALDADFPGAVYWQHAQAWQGARPVLADGLPAVGASGAEGIWLNVGHAHHGWPLSQVAAEALCAMVARQTPRVHVGALSPQRLG